MGSISIRVKKKVEDTKGVIRIRKSKKDKRSSKHTHKTKDQVTRTPLKTNGELKIREVSLIYMSEVTTF
jgi:hypothetical protein